jgi:thiosulfate dehydrogenase [quinone] large subunit
MTDTPAFGVPRAPGPQTPVESATRIAKLASLLPLRAFLGITFCFAGLQKLANPNFFDRNSPISIFSQMAGAERTSPIHVLLGHLLKVSTALGLMIAIGEVAIGLGVLTGLLTRLAALAGMALSLGLFLTVSFNANPYYTGADIVFFFAFTPLLLAGAGELLALDPLVRRRAEQISRGHPRFRQPAPSHAGTPLAKQRAGSADDYEIARRQLLARAAGALGAVGLAVIGLDAAIGRLVGAAKAPTPTTQLAGPSAGGPAATTSTTAGPATTGPTAAGPPAPGSGGTGAASSAAPTTTKAATGTTPPGKALGPASDVSVGGAATFQDPATGDPAIVIQLSAGQFVAYDTVCPHAGCTVGYSPGNKLLICPCHGSTFDPSNGDVLQGPAPTGLRKIEIAKGPNGDLYAV